MTEGYRRFLIAFCVYDVILLIGLALPLVNHHSLQLMSDLDVMMGAHPWPSSDPHFVVITGLFGTLAVFWVLWRLLHLSVEIGRFEGYLRFALGSWALAGYGVINSNIMLFLALAEFSIGWMHFWGAKQSIKASTAALIKENNEAISP